MACEAISTWPAGTQCATGRVRPDASVSSVQRIVNAAFSVVWYMGHLLFTFCSPKVARASTGRGRSAGPAG
ncbi:hypothetical protein NOCARDAX2BIS_30001 [Nocardioides sp. AX2bis]|nr:hypothetical protein NOCARDAX2BIS_30001 [Nocardioides sp. AX2bis]